MALTREDTDEDIDLLHFDGTTLVAGRITPPPCTKQPLQDSRFDIRRIQGVAERCDFAGNGEEGGSPLRQGPCAGRQEGRMRRPDHPGAQRLLWARLPPDNKGRATAATGGKGERPHALLLLCLHRIHLLAPEPQPQPEGSTDGRRDAASGRRGQRQLWHLLVLEGARLHLLRPWRPAHRHPLLRGSPEVSVGLPARAGRRDELLSPDQHVPAGQTTGQSHAVCRERHQGGQDQQQPQASDAGEVQSAVRHGARGRILTVLCAVQGGDGADGQGQQQHPENPGLLRVHHPRGL